MDTDDGPLELSINGVVMLRPTNIPLVPKAPGVYLIHDLRGTGYVGRSDNMQTRIEHHLTKAWNPRLTNFLHTSFGPLQLSWITTDNTHKVEQDLIRLLAPSANRIRYRTK